MQKTVLYRRGGGGSTCAMAESHLVSADRVGGKGSIHLTGQATSKMKPCSRDGIPSHPKKSTSNHQRPPGKRSTPSLPESPTNEEISKQALPRRRSSNLIAKLMGLDPLPAPEPSKTQQKDSSSEKSGEFKDVFEVLQTKDAEKQSHVALQRDDEVGIIERAFMDAKRLSTNEELKKSQKFGEALDLLHSRKDLLLKFLEEPNTRFKTLLKDLKPSRPAPEARITILKSSSIFMSEMAATKNATWQNAIDPSVDLESVPSRIVVLKPSIYRVDKDSADSSGASEDHQFAGSRRIRERRRSGRREALYELSDGELTHKTKRSGEIAKQVTRHMRRTISTRDAKRRLSERWTMAHKERDSLSSAGCSTLGEMLAFSDVDIQDSPVPVRLSIPSSPSPERVSGNNSSVPVSSASSGNSKSLTTSDGNDFTTLKSCSSRSYSSSPAVEKYCALDPNLEAPEKEAVAMTEEADQPSPISVLEPPESFEKLSADLQELRLKLQLLKLESVGADESGVTLSDEDDDKEPEQELEPEAEFTYLIEVLAEAGFRRNDWDELFCRFFAPEAPICPKVFHKLEKMRSSDDSSRGKSERKLLFDMFNGVLADLLTMNMELRPWVKNNRPFYGRRNLTEEAWEMLCRRRGEAISSSRVAFLEDPMWLDLVEDVDSIGRDVERIMVDDLLQDLVSDCIHF
ncbi:uncharacterized protein LOC144701641 [Wolffia australiana]